MLYEFHFSGFFIPYFFLPMKLEESAESWDTKMKQTIELETQNKNLKEQILDMEKQIAFYKDRLQSLEFTFTYASEISQITFPVRPEQQGEHIQEQQCAQREVDNRQEQQEKDTVRKNKGITGPLHIMKYIQQKTLTA